MNQKGGVGKTTTTVNLAAALARAGRSTLVIDLDPQAHATLHLGIEPGDGPTVYDLLLDPACDVGAAVRPVGENLAIIPSHTDLAAAEMELAAAPDRNQRLQRAIDRLAGRFEFVLVDCPPSLGLLTLNGLVLAREVIIPMQAHFLALQGVSKLLETVALVTRSVNPKLRVSGVVLCMHDTSSTHTREVVADLDRFFDEGRSAAEETPWKFARVYRPAVRRNIKLAECPSFGKTVFDSAPTATGAEDYAKLAEVMLREWDAMLARRAGEDEPPVVVVTTAARSAGTPTGAGA